MLPQSLFLSAASKKAISSFLVILVLGFYSQNIFAQQPAAGVSTRTKELFQAIRSGSTSELQQQLAKGASVNDSLNGYSALMAATLTGSVEQMKLLIEHGADVNYMAKDSTTALWIAMPDWDKTNLLLDHGADLQHRIGGYTVLVKLASLPGSIKLFRLMM
ncbi:MAG: ankyrin repeat domain-containing protein, partial [Bacteroidota bacterium]